MRRITPLSVTLLLFSFILSLLSARSARATDFYWMNFDGGLFYGATMWSPFDPGPGPPILGPGGAGDTVNFDRGRPAENPYTVTHVQGENARLLVHNDSVVLTLGGDYTLLDTGADNPSVVVGLAEGDSGNVLFDGEGTLHSQHASLGLVAGSTGRATIAGTQWIANGNLLVGDAGTGELTIEGEGVVSVANGIIGDKMGSTGAVQVTGTGSTWNVGDEIGVGRHGAGTLTVENGGKVESGNSPSSEVYLGGAMGTSGEATIRGAGSEWNHTGLMRLGTLGGTGTLTIEEGGKLTNGATSVGNATIKVRGAETFWSTQQLVTDVFMANPSSIITFEDGATVESTQFSLTGTLTIDGPGTTWTIEGGTSASSIGNSGIGLMTISNGAEVSLNRPLQLASFGSSNGTVIVRGAGSKLTTTDLTIGGAPTFTGRGSLNVIEGGQVTATGNSIMLGVGNSLAMVHGAGSRLEILGDFDIYHNALQVLEEGEAIIGGTLSAIAGGQILIDGGRLVVGELDETAFENLYWRRGTLRLNSPSGLTIGPGGLFGNDLLLEPNKRIEVGEQLLVESGATFFSKHELIAGSVVIEAGGQVFVGGTAHDVGSGLVNHGELVLTSASEVSGPVTIAAGGAVTALGDVVFHDMVDGPGGIYGQGMVTFAGGLSPGASPGELVIEGDVVLADTNRLAIEIAGTIPGSQFDLVTIGGAATLGGLLEVSLLDGFIPTGGEEFTVLTAASLVDAGLTLGGPAAELFELLVNESSVVLQAISLPLAGDYNGDGMVDAADYVVWRNTLGSTTNLAADGNRNGEIDVDDYLVWKDNFGKATTAAATTTPAAIPEPTTLLLVGLAGLGLFRRGARHRRR